MTKKIKSYDKSVILRKMYVDNVTLPELCKRLGECEYIEDLHLEDSEKKYIIGTIRKPYTYDAKRTIGNHDVTGLDECKFFKFIIKEEFGYFMIACHYEGNYGGFSILRDYLAREYKKQDIAFEIIYKEYKDILIADLKTIEWKSSTYTKEDKVFGIYKKTNASYITITIPENQHKDIANMENISKYVDLPDFDEEDEGISLYLTLKNNRKINILQPQNTHFKLEDIPYENNLPKATEFANQVYQIWEAI